MASKSLSHDEVCNYTAFNLSTIRTGSSHHSPTVLLETRSALELSPVKPAWRHLPGSEEMYVVEANFLVIRGLYSNSMIVSYGQDAEMSDAKEGQTEVQLTQSPVIVRATNGKSKRNRAEKIKLSTVVEPGDLEGFYVRYGEVCKTGMTALKPRDRSKKKAKAKKKKTTAAA